VEEETRASVRQSHQRTTHNLSVSAMDWRKWLALVLIVLVMPPAVAIILFVPFGTISWHVTNFFDGDNFYYPAATLLWPGYASLVSLSLVLLGKALRLKRLLSLFLLLNGFLAIFSYVGLFEFGPWLTEIGLNYDDTGLWSWPANDPDAIITTPVISVVLVPVIYWLTAVVAAVVLRSCFKETAGDDAVGVTSDEHSVEKNVKMG
jgi:hypothetical protein